MGFLVQDFKCGTCIVLGITDVMPKGSLRSSPMVESDV